MKKVTFAIVLLLQYRKSEGDRAVNNLHWCACHNEPTLRHRQKKKKSGTAHSHGKQRGRETITASWWASCFSVNLVSGTRRLFGCISSWIPRATCVDCFSTCDTLRAPDRPSTGSSEQDVRNERRAEAGRCRPQRATRRDRCRGARGATGSESRGRSTTADGQKKKKNLSSDATRTRSAILSSKF